jgi:transcriptional antiterminator RfaH
VVAGLVGAARRRQRRESVVSQSNTQWYVAQSHPHAENKAVSHLNRQGFETYLPLHQKRRRHARRTETIAAPLFPRYLFVAVDIAAQRWLSIQSTIGVSKLVCNGNVPAPVPAGVVEALKYREDENGFFVMDTRPRFAPGDSVRIVDGAFASCLGQFEGLKAGERVAVLLDLLGRKVRVVLDDLSVAAA